jgi:hydrogenase maturation protein HypF
MATSITPLPSAASTFVVTPGAPLEARLIVVEGVVQGVGFRPFVHRVATAQGITGSVRNDGTRVIIDACGTATALDALHHALLSDLPPLAKVDRVVMTAVPTSEDTAAGFTVGESTAPTVRAGTSARLTSDAGICERCEAELMDERDRRFRHAFISCTDCGPRWSMIEALPYDRVRTSMRTLPLCAACEVEYRNPADRRFHAESVCCPSCGPTLSAFASNGSSLGTNSEAIAAAVHVIRTGGIVALHGIGGFHLATDATNDQAVARLRTRKHRPAKPLAVMVRTLADAHALVGLDEGSATLLQRAERPVMIAPMRAATAIAPSVAPGLTEMGVMLPSTAVHHLLLHDAGVPLVMTSGNASGEPLAATAHEAWRDLAGIADLLLVHDRPVVAPSDDTVLRREPAGHVVMRSARGWSPTRITLPYGAPVPILSLGGDLKATVALASGPHAWLSAHLGDQSSLAVQERTADVIARFIALSGCTPALVACDAHPGYASTAMLERWQDAPAAAPWHTDAPLTVHRVQHHHAHVAAVLVEHGVRHPVVALAFDGAGWGPDGTIWGGEVLVADLTVMTRVGSLSDAPLIGGDLAAREPWRAALGWLHDFPGHAYSAVTANLPTLPVQVARQLATRDSVVRTSSMGRLFDAASAVLQLAPRNSYEGEAAARLEALAGCVGAQAGEAFPFVEAVANGGPWRLDPRHALETLAERHAAGVSASQLAAAWHDDVVATSVAAARRALAEHAVAGTPPTVVLCGGVFQNVRLLHGIRATLESLGISVLVARALPPNDGAIAVGQVAIAAASAVHGTATPFPAGSNS